MSRLTINNTRIVGNNAVNGGGVYFGGIDLTLVMNECKKKNWKIN